MSGGGPELGDTRFVRNADILFRTVNDAVFLVDDGGGGIFYLNAIGAAVWRLLAKPTSVVTAAALVADAFPEIERSAIEADVTALIQKMAHNGLVVARR